MKINPGSIEHNKNSAHVIYIGGRYIHTKKTSYLDTKTGILYVSPVDYSYNNLKPLLGIPHIQHNNKMDAIFKQYFYPMIIGKLGMDKEGRLFTYHYHEQKNSTMRFTDNENAKTICLEENAYKIPVIDKNSKEGRKILKDMLSELKAKISLLLLLDKNEVKDTLMSDNSTAARAIKEVIGAVSSYSLQGVTQTMLTQMRRVMLRDNYNEYATGHVEIQMIGAFDINNGIIPNANEVEYVTHI